MIKVIKETENTLHLQDKSLHFLFAGVVVGVVIFFQLYTEYNVSGVLDERYIFGGVAGALICFACFIAYFRTTDFQFGPNNQFRYKITSMTSRSSGVVNYEDIEAVVLESITTPTIMSYRVAVRIKNEVLPLSHSYVPRLKELEDFANRIRTLIGHEVEEQALTQNSVESLVSQGSIINAVTLLKVRENLSLTEARTRVKEIQNKLSK